MSQSAKANCSSLEETKFLFLLLIISANIWDTRTANYKFGVFLLALVKTHIWFPFGIQLRLHCLSTVWVAELFLFSHYKKLYFIIYLLSCLFRVEVTIAFIIRIKFFLLAFILLFLFFIFASTKVRNIILVTPGLKKLKQMKKKFSIDSSLRRLVKKPQEKC